MEGFLDVVYFWFGFFGFCFNCFLFFNFICVEELIELMILGLFYFVLGGLVILYLVN